jgi:hypothetical protein
MQPPVALFILVVLYCEFLLLFLLFYLNEAWVRVAILYAILFIFRASFEDKIYCYIQSLYQTSYRKWISFVVLFISTSCNFFSIICPYTMQNTSASLDKVFPIIVSVIICHFIFISSISTVYKNTYNLRSSNQLFRNCPHPKFRPRA